MDEFNTVIDTWISIISNYTIEKLRAQSDKNSWSVGQIGVHLLNDTNWFLEQIKICLQTDANATKTMSAFAKNMFNKNSFPNKRLENPANANMPQPKSKEDLLTSFITLKKEMNCVAENILNNKLSGKTKHPGFGYLNATEWLQFATMHLNHHLKQKQRIENVVH